MKLQAAPLQSDAGGWVWWGVRYYVDDTVTPEPRLGGAMPPEQPVIPPREVLTP